MRNPAKIWLATGLAVAAMTPLLAQAAQDGVEAPTPRPTLDLGKPYIGGPLPGGERLIHPPPQASSTRMAIDEEAHQRALSLQDSARWHLAARDADLGDGWYGRAFSCAAGVEISARATPHIAHLLRRAATDFGGSTSAVKAQFQRARPFMADNEPTCTPEDEPFLRGNGSYPSGHSAIGYGLGMLLANIFPDRAADLLARGRGYANSRWVCNVHWYSDTTESQAFAAATFARLQANDEFRADLALAREEASGLAPADANEICMAEGAALTGGATRQDN